jgi:hypothetical protein
MRVVQPLPLLLTAATLLRAASTTQVRDTCYSDAGCGDGRDRLCTRAMPINPATRDTPLPFN